MAKGLTRLAGFLLASIVVLYLVRNNFQQSHGTVLSKEAKKVYREEPIDDSSIEISIPDKEEDSFIMESSGSNPTKYKDPNQAKIPQNLQQLDLKQRSSNQSPPSKPGSFEFQNPVGNPDQYFKSQEGQDKWIFERFMKGDIDGNRKRGGFFIEFGARDGVSHSNTYFLEKFLGWHGVLIEASPTEQKNIASTRSRSAVINGAVCETQGGSVKFMEIGNAIGWGGIKTTYDGERLIEKSGSSREIEVPCFRLDHVVQMFDVTEVDYLSVDTEGSELKALSTFPFDKIKPRLIGVEVLVGLKRGHVQDDLLDFMDGKGYKIRHIQPVSSDTLDFFFEPKNSPEWFADGYKSRMTDKISGFWEKRLLCQKSKACLIDKEDEQIKH